MRSIQLAIPSTDRLLPVVSSAWECVDTLHFLFELRPEHHFVERRLGDQEALWPDSELRQ